MINRILLIQTASIGDVILITPLIEKLHQYYPEAKIDLLVKKGYEGLFDNHPYIETLWLWNKNNGKYKNLLQLGLHIRNTRYDVVVNAQRFASTGLIVLFSGAKIRIGFDKNPFSLFYSKRVKHTIHKQNPGFHEIDRNLSLIAHITDGKRTMPKLYPGATHIARVSPYKTKAYITIAPASLWFTKQFPEYKWVDFLQQIPQNLHVYLLGSKDDEMLCQRIIEQSDHKSCINFAGKLNLLESAALMRDATMNFVNDSAPMHLGSSVNAKMTVIYCSTIPGFGFGPLSQDSLVIETPEKLPCRPCGLHGKLSCPEKHFNCANNIQSATLLNRL